MKTLRPTAALPLVVLVPAVLMSCGDADPTTTDSPDPTPTGAAELVAEPATLDFGAVPEGIEQLGTIVITNVGTAPALLTDLFISGSDDFTLIDPSESILPFTLDVYDPIADAPSLTVVIRFLPSPSGANEAVLLTRIESPRAESLNLAIVGLASVGAD